MVAIACNQISCVQGAVNLMDSVAGMGFYGTRGGKLWCRSHTESFYLWDWSAACNEESTGKTPPPLHPSLSPLFLPCPIACNGLGLIGQ